MISPRGVAAIGAPSCLPSNQSAGVLGSRGLPSQAQTLRPAGLTVTGENSGGGLLQNSPAGVSPSRASPTGGCAIGFPSGTCESRWSGGLSSYGGAQGGWSQVSGSGFDPSRELVAAGSAGRRRGSGSPAAVLADGGAPRRGIFFCFSGAAVNFLSVGWMLAREDGGGGTLEAGGGQGHPWFGSWTVQNRVTPGLVTGRCRTGSPPVGRLDGPEQGHP